MHTLINTLRTIVLFTLLVATCTVQAQLQPATLGDPAAERYFLKHIGFPDTQGDASVTISCATLVKGNGKLKNTHCYIKDNWDPDFAQAVEKGAKKAVLSPARNGKKTPTVGLLFQVVFLKKEDKRSITIILNPGMEEMVEAYGKFHISAQRVMGKENWGKSCPRHAKWLLFAQSHVDESGVASSVELGHGNGIIPTGTCQQAIINTITSSQFAPATVDGVAVPGVYVEPFGGG